MAAALSHLSSARGVNSYVQSGALARSSAHVLLRSLIENLFPDFNLGQIQPGGTAIARERHKSFTLASRVERDPN